MKLPATTAAAFSLALGLTAPAQHTFSDPANLRGERPNPRTGRELPIDGGLGADGEPDAALGLQQLLRKLSTRASVLNIVAHPDDEDGGMLTFCSRGLGARVADLALTRGEGGQNAVNGDFEDALGLLRTQELLANDRYTGVDQFFGTEVDFGFSKTKQEAFAKWTHERVLYDAVRAIRLYRPLVITATFTGGVTDGHGQHQVSGQIAQEAFLAAGNPKVFAGMIAEGIAPWQPLKVYARVPSFAITGKGLFDYATGQYVPPTFTNYVTGLTSATPPTPDITVHEGQPDPLLTPAAANPEDLPKSLSDPHQTLSYVQFARIGLGLQRTQIGPGVRNAPTGPYDAAFHRYGSRLAVQPAHETSFFDGIDTSLEGIATLSSAPPPALVRGLRHLNTQISEAREAFRPASPAALGPALVAAQHDLGALLDQLETSRFPGRNDVLHELRIKQVQLNDAIATALGLHLEATAQSSSQNILLNNSLKVRSTLTSASAEPVGVFAESLEASLGNKTELLLAVDTEPSLTADRSFSQSLEATAALMSKLTRPYFTRDDVEEPAYQLIDPALRNAPATPPALTAWATLRYHQTEVRVGRVVAVNRQAVQIVPPVSVQLPSRAQALPLTEEHLRVEAKLAPPAESTAAVTLGFSLPPFLQGAAQSQIGPQQWQLVATRTAAARETPGMIRAMAQTGDGKTFAEGYRAVGYPGLPLTNEFTPAAIRIVPVDLTLPTHRRLAYLPGTGDAVPQALASIGLTPTTLTVADLNPNTLAHFDTVILGVRTYNAHPDLHGAPTQALLDFARAGGNVVVQYQTPEFTAADAPYTLALGSNERVVDETAPVHLLDPGAPVLTTPNRLTPADFNGWIEERGHGFLQTWDPRYTALTETHDPGVPSEHVEPQLPQRGGLITTQLGRGHWTYVAYALYRQLPEAVPGAFRLFTNLLALSDQPSH